ncbi:MAG: hypothetical protein H6838_17100 [Planctomycetes bacterium]|nr:hypothetical protein [Planctomycetota bacterium]MCB9887211.1 hypothetical protein [Planctomycetota bacterium]
MPRTALLAIAASLLSFVPAAAQNGGSTDPVAKEKAAAPDPLLSASEQASLRAKLIKYLEADEIYMAATDAKDREKAGSKRSKAKEDFEKEWDRLGKKGDLLGSMPDMRAVFDNCFTVKRPSFSLNQLRKGVNKEDGVEFSFWVPKSYKPENPMATVIALPGAVGGGKWDRAQDYFQKLFEKSSLANNNIVHVCQLPEGTEVDVPPDYTKEGAEVEELRRIGSVFSGFAETMNTLNVDRARVFLDCSKGNSAFGLRFVTLFPDRFAGVILRDPVAVDELRLGSLSNVPVLLFKTADNGQVVDALAARLKAVNPEGVTLVDATDAFPFKASNDFVEEWMGKQRRRMTPLSVVIEPNHDRFNRAYWVDMHTVSPLLTSPADKKPRLEVTADRASNRIDVKAVGVESFYLYLNDELVDLSKEFTVVVNGKAVTEKRTRSFSLMQEGLLQRRDWDYLYPVVYHSTVPTDPVEPKK